MRRSTLFELAAPGGIPTGSPLEAVEFYFDAGIGDLNALFPGRNMVILTDEHVREHQGHRFAGLPVICIPPGEQHKTQETVTRVINELIGMEAGRDCCLVGVGGGVVTDITGYVASVYMRGIAFGFVPSTILAMADAAIGGKNGIDIGVYKNMVGTIRQPSFILYDYALLESLPAEEWVNGFAEVIKHACIRDLLLFQKLEKFSLHDYRSDITLLADLIETNASIKASVVIADEFEKGERKLLNFGHTIGHAVENLHQLPHGHAVSIGMVAACALSEKLCGFHFTEGRRVVELLAKYHLPVDLETDHERVFEVLKMDKKRGGGEISFILLNTIGSACIKPIPLDLARTYLKEIL